LILISHRGNIKGPNPERENSPSYIMEALHQGFQVEADVWWHREGFVLGHDQPTYPIEFGFLFQSNLWCHAKNTTALIRMVNHHIHCFWHQNDDVVLTSQNYLWTFPGKTIAHERAIAVMPETVKDWDYRQAIGICSDYIGEM